MNDQCVASVDVKRIVGFICSCDKAFVEMVEQFSSRCRQFHSKNPQRLHTQGYEPGLSAQSIHIGVSDFIHQLDVYGSSANSGELLS